MFEPSCFVMKCYWFSGLLLPLEPQPPALGWSRSSGIASRIRPALWSTWSEIEFRSTPPCVWFRAIFYVADDICVFNYGSFTLHCDICYSRVYRYISILVNDMWEKQFSSQNANFVTIQINYSTLFYMNPKWSFYGDSVGIWLQITLKLRFKHRMSTRQCFSKDKRDL